ncbi:MAG: hypothetical protein IJ711_01665, partial [Lachnospiraceae bacterium]|nr:hypothetical protein [Lachnospiraceae bacterium]
AYQSLIGKKLNESDQLILDKTTLILKLQRKYDSFLNYQSMGNAEYACNALLGGYKFYKESYETAVQYNILDEFEMIKKMIVDALWNTFGISEEKADELNAIEDAVQYKESIRQILQDKPSENTAVEDASPSYNETPDELPDILDEEQEMIQQMDE